MLPVPPRPSLITVSADHLRHAFASGEWSHALPSERKLCTRLGISRPTLRAVLSQLEQEGWLSPVVANTRHILRPTVSPKKEQSSAPVTVLSPIPARVMPPFVLFWLDVLRGLLAESGRTLDVCTSPAAYLTHPHSTLSKITSERPSSAWILFLSTSPMQEWFAQQRLPVVIAGTRTVDAELPCVDVDYRATCRHAATVLRRAGHRQAALLLSKGGHGGDQESEIGFLEGWQDASSGRVIRHQESPASLISAVDRALASASPPSAFIVARSVHVLTVITHLQRSGYRLPTDIAIISRDDDAFLDHVVPQVARYAADPAKFAKRLAKLVLQLADTGRTTSQPARLMPEWIKGETV
jgi:DNA-binding LacI/PurR family transcriptional regulator